MYRTNLTFRNPQSAPAEAPRSPLSERESGGTSLLPEEGTHPQTNLPKHPPERRSGPIGSGQLVAMARARTAAPDSNTEKLDEMGKKIYAQIQGLNLPVVNEKAAKDMAWYAQEYFKGSAPEGTGVIDKSEKATLGSLTENLSKDFPFISIPVAKKMMLYARDELRPSAPSQTALEGVASSSTSEPAAVPSQRNPKLDLPPQYGSRAALEDTRLTGEAFDAATTHIFHSQAFSPEHGIGTPDAIESSRQKLMRQGQEQAKEDEQGKLDSYKDISKFSDETVKDEIINLKLDMANPAPGKKEFVFKAFANSICSFYERPGDAKRHKDNCRHVIGELKQLMDKFSDGIPDDLMTHAVSAMVAQENHALPLVQLQCRRSGESLSEHISALPHS